MTDNKGTKRLATLFWAAASGNVLLLLIPALHAWTHPQGEFSGLAAFSLLLIALCLVVVSAVVALLRNRLAYGIGLVLVCVPAVWFALSGVGLVVASLSAPSIADQDAGRGYFATPADRALAEAIVAGTP